MKNCNNRKSNPYASQIRINTYNLLTISVATSLADNSITINVTSGDGNIVSYKYLKD